MKIDASIIESECKCLKRAKMNDETKTVAADLSSGMSWKGEQRWRRRAGRCNKNQEKESKSKSTLEG